MKMRRSRPQRRKKQKERVSRKCHRKPKNRKPNGPELDICGAKARSCFWRKVSFKYLRIQKQANGTTFSGANGYGTKCDAKEILVPYGFADVATLFSYDTRSFATVEDIPLLHEDKIYSESKIREVSASTKKKERTVAITAEDMQKRKNDVKTRTTLLLALPDEHQLRFSKYDTAKELWEAILKTFGGNEATKKTKKNRLKQQYGNFKDEGSETLEQTFNRLQAIVSHLEFMDVPIKQDDLNQKFLTILAPECLVYTIIRRNRDYLDTMSLDDVYNHLKVYKPKVQKRAGSNSQNMAFISSSNTSSGKSEVPTVQRVSTASVQVSTDSTNVAALVLTNQKLNASIATRWVILLESVDHQGVKIEGRESYKKDPTVEEHAPKAIIAIGGIGWDRSYISEENEALKNHALVAAEEEIPT
nr:hypothetical protein [Tanacetum cinerariifolium]